MDVSRATLVGLLAVAASCSRTHGPPAAPDSAAAPRSEVRVEPTAVPHRTESPEPDALGRAIALAYPQTPLDHTQFEALASQLSLETRPQVRAALAFAAGRRAPRTDLARLWSLVRPDEYDSLSRGLAGRERSESPTELPPPLLERLTGPHPDAALATAAGRLSIPLPGLSSSLSPLLAASWQDQLAAARLVYAPSVALPDPAALALVGPTIWPSLVRGLSSRPAFGPAQWAEAVSLMGSRAGTAPRQWANAWRAVRDGAPASPEVLSALQAGSQLADGAHGLPPLVRTTLRCENASRLDRLVGGWPLASLHCAEQGLGWVSLAAQAEVLGSAVTEARRRANALEAIASAANGEPHVLEAVASAATALPASVVGPLLQRLGNQRDPGVLAALLEGLALHVQQARALPPPLRQQLLRAPFDLPEGPALEARIHALDVAHALHDDTLDPLAAPSSVRAVQHALIADAGTTPMIPAPSSGSHPVHARIVTELGPIEIELHPDSAPRAVEQFVTAARAHRYDGLTFHRVVPGFVVQGGDPHGDGYGGTESPVPTELSLEHFDRGALGIALAGLDTGGIQFFIVTADAPHLDGRYPWIGRVTRGIEIADGLLVGDRIERIEIVEQP